MKTDDKSLKLGGISIGLAMNSVYTYEENGAAKELKIDRTKLEKEGKKIAAEVVKRIRGVEGLGQVPIIISLLNKRKALQLYLETSSLTQR